MRFIQTIYTIWQREIVRYTRAKARILSTLFQPIMFLVIFGVGLKETFAASNFGIDFLQFMYPGIIAISVMSVAIFSTISTVWDREFGFLKEILVTPTPRSAIALGKTLGATTIATGQALILLVLAPLLGITIALPSLFPLLLLMFLLAFALSGLGLFIASLMQTTENFGIVMQLLIFPLFFLSGAFFPLTAVPAWMGAVAAVNPLTYGVDAFRQVLLGGTAAHATLARLSLHTVSLDALFLAAFSCVMVGAAVIAFNKK